MSLGLEDRSARLLSGRDVWSEIKLLLSGYNDVQAAIAFVGADADQYLQLRGPATIVVNAGEEALRNGWTDPSVLLRWTRRGVRVHTLSTLHAKLMVAQGSQPFVLVGSADVLSTSGRAMEEAILLADEKDTVDEVRRAVDRWRRLAGEPLTDAWLQAAALRYRPPGTVSAAAGASAVAGPPAAVASAAVASAPIDPAPASVKSATASIMSATPAEPAVPTEPASPLEPAPSALPMDSEPAAAAPVEPAGLAPLEPSVAVAADESAEVGVPAEADAGFEVPADTAASVEPAAEVAPTAVPSDSSASDSSTSDGSVPDSASDGSAPAQVDGAFSSPAAPDLPPIWPRPKFIYLATLTKDGRASESAKEQLDVLRADHRVPGDPGSEPLLDVEMFWWDAATRSAAKSTTYREGWHIVPISVPASGRPAVLSPVHSPGRVLHSFTEYAGGPARTYYYLLIHQQGVPTTFRKLREALTAVGEKPSYDHAYMMQHKVAAILDLWPTVHYTG